jgi:crotonobetainyl-CoA:carnitine CoA-transferase CaiB-like acyl-CoA transferase
MVLWGTLYEHFEDEDLLDNELVLDLASEEGSFCSELFAEPGAKVIKIEPLCLTSTENFFVKNFG